MNHPFLGVIFVVKKGRSRRLYIYWLLPFLYIILQFFFFILFCNFHQHLQGNKLRHGLRTPREEIAFTARPKIQSQSQIFRYGRSIFRLPHWPNFSEIFDLCLHRVSVVRVCLQYKNSAY